MNSVWIEITRSGESGLLLPIAALMLIWFVFFARPMAITWASIFGIGVCIVVASKVAFLGWGIGVRSLNFTGFSGHTMLATAVYPTIAWFCVAPHRRKLRVGLLVLATVFAVLVGWSRLALNAHSVSEVITGFLLGAAVACAFIYVNHSQVSAMVPVWPLALAFVAFEMIGFNRFAPSHQIIVRVALAVSGREHPFRRDQWLQQQPDT